MYCKNIGKEAALERINLYNIQYFSIYTQYIQYKLNNRHHFGYVAEIYVHMLNFLPPSGIVIRPIIDQYISVLAPFPSPPHVQLLRSQQCPDKHQVIHMLNVTTLSDIRSGRMTLEKAVRNHLQGTQVHFQAVSNKNGVCTDEAQ